MKHSRRECEASEREYKNTNPRYRNFFQEIFTAGDEEQFQESRDFSDCIPKSIKPSEDFDTWSFDIWKGNSNLSGECVTTTFRYIFNKFKKGIYIKIKDNKLCTFLPFSKAKFFNEWSDRIHINPKFRNVIEFMRHINRMENRPFHERRVNRFINGWYANNCLVRYEFPLSEGDTGTVHLQNMFDELCQNRQVPDIELFINRRDFPMLKTDYTEPYDQMWDSETQPLVSHNYEKYFPILSSVTKNGFADLPIPTIDDWARVKSFENVFFPKTHTRNYTEEFPTLWDDKKETAVFRGGSTGIGVDIETNPRLKVAYLSKKTPKDVDGVSLIDAGITDWNLRPRKIKGEKFLKTIEIDSMPFKLVEKLNAQEQSVYKYIIHIDGHVSAFRLSIEMNMGSTILMVDSDYKMWYRHLLIPFIHYVPVKRDLSDLVDTIKWCKKNDEKCKKIAENCKIFYKKYLDKNGIFNYLQTLLVKLNTSMGVYTYAEHPLSIQLRDEYEALVKLSTLDYTFARNLYKTRLSTIDEYSGGIVVKITSDPKKKKENIHEAFIGTKEINLIRSRIPNFCKTYGLLEKGDELCVVSKKIDGISMLDWMNSDKFNFADFVIILKQLVLALEVAQKSCGFVHYDLFQWNVIIQTLEKPKTIEYILSYNKVFRLETSIIPVIIDYGKSHVIHKGKHIGFVNMFNFNYMQDVRSIFISSISNLVKRYVHVDVDFIIKGLQFISPDANISSYGQATKFVTENSSFTSMIASAETRDTRTPIDFFEHLWKPKYDICQTETNRHRAKLTTQYVFNDKINAYYFQQLLSNSVNNIDTCVFKPVTNLDDYTCVSYTEEILYNHSKCHAVLKDYRKGEDWSSLKEMLEYIITYRGEYEVSDDDREKMKIIYREILNIKTQYVKNYFANYTTLNRYSL